MHTATTLCFVRTSTGAVTKVAEGETMPEDATESEVARLLAAGAIAPTKSEPKRTARRADDD